MSSTPKVYLTSPVFREIADNPRVSVKYKFLINKVWSNLNTAADVIVADSRFPSEEEIKRVVSQKEVDFIGCHIGHRNQRGDRFHSRASRPSAPATSAGTTSTCTRG